MLRGLCIMSAWHFIDLIQGEGKILLQFSELPNVSSRDTSSHIPGVCSAGYCVCVLKNIIPHYDLLSEDQVECKL